MPTAGSKAPGKVTREKKAAKVAQRKNPGTPAHVPTEQTRALVSLCMAIGYTHEQAARLVGICADTLAKHYPEELANGAERINAAVAKNLYSIATQQQDRKAALTAAIFICKTRLRWREKDDVSAVVESDGPVRVTLKIGNAAPADA